MPQTILVVEDEPMIGAGVRDLLNDSGYEVLGPCLTVREANRLIDLFRPDAAILDIQLIDGAVDAILERLADERISFCIMSGHKRPEAAEGWMARVEWLEKPFHESDLLDVVHRLLA